MRPILWQVEPDADRPTFSVLFPGKPGEHLVATLRFRSPVPEGVDPKAHAMNELSALSDEALALVREIARPVAL